MFEIPSSHWYIYPFYPTRWVNMDLRYGVLTITPIFMVWSREGFNKHHSYLILLISKTPKASTSERYTCTKKNRIYQGKYYTYLALHTLHNYILRNKTNVLIHCLSHQFHKTLTHVFGS